MKLLERLKSKFGTTNGQLPVEITQERVKNKLIVLPGESFTPQEYVQNLITQLEHDIFPLFSIKGSAPFTIARNSFCFVDHISRLIYGKKKNQTWRMKKVLKEFAPNEAYINNHYSDYAPYLVQLYRHDLVHNVRPLPKEITIRENQKNTKTTSWFFMFSKHETGTSFDELKTNFNKSKFRKGYCHLRYTGNQVVINTNSLFFDLIIFLEALVKQLDASKSLRTNFTDNYYAVIEENYFKINKLLLDKDKNKEVTDIFHNK